MSGTGAAGERYAEREDFGEVSEYATLVETRVEGSTNPAGWRLLHLLQPVFTQPVGRQERLVAILAQCVLAS